MRWPSSAMNLCYLRATTSPTLTSELPLPSNSATGPYGLWRVLTLINSTNTVIGQPARRREDFRLLTGKGCYSDDFSFPGQAYAVMVRSPHAHARIRSIDTRAAEAASGVLAVLTGRDMRDDGLQAIPHSVGTRHPADITLENTDGSPPFIPPHFPLTTEEARHCGEIAGGGGGPT